MDRPTQEDQQIRLQRFLARCGVASRRSSEKLIVEGRVSINGKVITELGVKVNPESDIVCLDGVELSLPNNDITIKLNKPVGYLTSMSDPFGRKCVSELIPIDKYPSLFPIGRLDRDTSGLLLFTTDGALGQALAHPSKKIDKTYIAKLDGFITDEALDPLREGIYLKDGICQPAKCKILKATKRFSEVSITIHEGRNRQVRRMFDAIGYKVCALRRITVGPIVLDGLKSGEYKKLTDDELRLLRDATSSLKND